MNFRILQLNTEKFSDFSNFHLPRPYKKGKAFYISFDLEGTSIPILDRFFSFDVTLIAPVKDRHALY